jgi:DNA-binding IclR family transcriptional regulator
MAKTLVRGLELIEDLGLYGPMTISELARRNGVHVSIVSRTVAMLEPEGWMVRIDGKIAAGPRCALLGLISPAGKTVRRAESLVKALAAVTGVATAASGLIGRDVMILSASSGMGTELPDGFSSRLPVYVMAAGRAIATELSEQTLDAILPDGDFPNATRVLESLDGSAPIPRFLASAGPDDEAPGSIPLTRADLDAEIATIRTDGFARDHGELHPAIHCIAAPWPTPELPASLACIGSREEIDTNRTTIEACLRAAIRPGAGAQDVFDVAARGPDKMPSGGKVDQATRRRRP